MLNVVSTRPHNVRINAAREALMTTAEPVAAQWVAGLPFAADGQGLPVPIAHLAELFRDQHADALDADEAAAVLMAVLDVCDAVSGSVVPDDSGLPVELLLSLPLAAPSPARVFRVGSHDVLVLDGLTLRRAVMVADPMGGATLREVQ